MRKVIPLSADIFTTFVGRVSPLGVRRADDGDVREPSDFMVTVIIPEGAKPALRRGQEVSVTLPIIHHGKTAASVAALAPGEIRLLLAKQVQELNGQEVRVEIPLKPQGICRVPFQSIDSPRGLSKQVLVLNDNHVEARDVKIVALAGGTDILVTGPLAAGDQVVVEGLDNLLSGDEVQVVPAPEGAE